MKRPTLAVLLASATAILPALVLGSIASAAEALPGEAFQLPAAGDQLVLTRELHKPLHDGSEVFTKRAYAIHITPIDGGYRVDGTLIAVEVVAPAALEPIAELERKRPDAGYFPVWLDAAGMIVRESNVSESGALSKASEIVGGWLGRSSLETPDRQAVTRFVAQLQALGTAAGGALPRDLFHPAAGQHTETRDVDLPDGNKGKIKIEIDASTRDASGLLGRIERRVTTDLGGDQRMTREVWRLTGAGN